MRKATDRDWWRLQRTQSGLNSEDEKDKVQGLQGLLGLGDFSDWQMDISKMEVRARCTLRPTRPQLPSVYSCPSSRLSHTHTNTHTHTCRHGTRSPFTVRTRRVCPHPRELLATERLPRTPLTCVRVAGTTQVGPRIAGGSFADLHMGTYCGQTVAVKVLRGPTADDVGASAALQEEFVKEVSILRKVSRVCPHTLAPPSVLQR